MLNVDLIIFFSSTNIFKRKNLESAPVAASVAASVAAAVAASVAVAAAAAEPPKHL